MVESLVNSTSGGFISETKGNVFIKSEALSNLTLLNKVLFLSCKK